MRNRVVIALFLLLVPPYSCKSPSSPEPIVSFRIEGIVTDSKTGMPIAGALVRRVPNSYWSRDYVLQEVRCDGDGKYSLAFSDPCPKPGELGDDVIVYVDGYCMSPSEYFGYEIKCTPEVQIANFALIPL